MIRKRQCLRPQSSATGEARFVNRLFRLAAWRLIRQGGKARPRPGLANATEPNALLHVTLRSVRLIRAPPAKSSAGSGGGRVAKILSTP